jgi:hypothetical protein
MTGLVVAGLSSARVNDGNDEAPRYVHHRSYVAARRWLDENRIPHYAEYTKRHNALIVFSTGIEAPVATASLRFDRTWTHEIACDFVVPSKNGRDYMVLVARDQDFVQVVQRVPCEIIVRNSTLGIETRDTHMVWRAMSVA